MFDESYEKKSIRFSYNRFAEFRQMVPCSEVGRSLNWLIVMPKFMLLDDQQYVFPIGMAYVSSALKASGRNVFTLNLNNNREPTYDLLRTVIEENCIDVIATGGLTRDYAYVKEVLDTAKQIKHDITTVVGGGLISSDPVAAMTALESAKYGVIGEGEITLCELAYAMEMNLEFNTINGLVLKTKMGQWEITPPRAEIDNLDAIPWPDYEGFEYEKLLDKAPNDFFTAQNGQRIGTVLCSRSCPYNCTFCFHTSGKKYRTRSLDSFFEEFDYLVKRYGINAFYLSDEFFLRNLEFVRDFCARIRPYKMIWGCQGRVDNITREMLELLKSAGCHDIFFGVESANDRVLKSMRKNTTRAQIENAFSLCQEAALKAQGVLIFGDLEETVETAMDSINWLKSHPDWAIEMHWIIPFPGSYVYQVSCERGLIPDPVQYIINGCPEINFSKMTTEERRKIAAIIEMSASEGHEILRDASLSPGDGGKLVVTGNCPYCGEPNTFRNLHSVRAPSFETCFGCQCKLSLYASDYICVETVDANICQILQSHKIALWPVVTGIAKLIERVPALRSDNVYFIDSSIYKQGIELSGKIISPPDVIHEQGIDVVLITVISNAGKEITDDIRVSFPEVKHVELIGNLFFPHCDLPKIL